MEYSKKLIFENIKRRWDSIAKPLDSLGKLEEIVCRIGAVQGTEEPRAKKTALIVFCADNGVVEEGISQSDMSVTRLCAENIASGKTTVGIMAGQYGTDVIAVDIGMNCDKVPGVLDRKIRKGSRNFAKEKALTAAEVQKAIECGKSLVRELKAEGYDILCVGEMGIGNTATSAAVASSLLKVGAEEVTGRGAGLSDIMLKKKISVIQSAVEKYGLYEKDVLEVLEAAGGYDICGMCGVFLGAAEENMPVVLDGAISMVSLLAAERIKKGTKEFVIPSHKSREPLVSKVCSELNLEPVLDAGMALGEGTGAVLMMGIIKTALAVYEKSLTFNKSGVQQYIRQSGKKSPASGEGVN